MTVRTKGPAIIRKKVTAEAFDAQRVGAQQVAPGIWIDRHGGVHWSVPELLALVDLEDTPANREAVVATVLDSLRGYGIQIVRQDPVTS